MKPFRSVVILAALLTTACSAATVSPAVSTNPSAAAGQSGVESTPVASAPAADVLTGQWTASSTTCAEQNAAVEAAGFTAEQMALGGWSPTCAEGMPHGSRFTITFHAGKLVIYQDGGEGWTGNYRITDDETLEAGGNGTFYITYHFVIDGDQLTVDMIKDDCPYCTTPAERAGEQIAQTVIYETSPFTRLN